MYVVIRNVSRVLGVKRVGNDSVELYADPDLHLYFLSCRARPSQTRSDLVVLCLVLSYLQILSHIIVKL